MARRSSWPHVLRRRPLQLLAAVLLGVALLALSAVSSRAAEPTIEATGTSLATYAWSPPTAEVEAGGSVAFKNPNATPHGLAWDSGPETPGCAGTPSLGQGNWSGSCSFAQGGTYAFHCPVHPAQMKGTVTVNGPAAPVVSTGAATGVDETSATLNGTVNPSGQATTYYFEYGTTTGYGQKTTEAAAGEGTSPVARSAALGSLAAATVYHFRIVAKNPTGTTLGGDRSFSTTGPPAATTGAAAGVNDTEATLDGTVNPHGLATTYFFEYGETAAYGQSTAEFAAGSGIAGVTASALLTGLSPATTYHFQLVAKNSSGTTIGGDQTFSTAAAPPVDPPPTSGAPPSAPPPALPIPPLTTPPETKITLKPRAKSRDRTPTVKFSATLPGAVYRCSIDGKPFKACRSPYTTPVLKPGRHNLRIVAVAAGLADPTPAACSFKILAAKR